MALRLQLYLSRVNILPNPLKLFFRKCLRNVSVIPIYGLVLIADFYERANKLEEALESTTLH